jgi:predicted nucleotidyltransferase
MRSELLRRIGEAISDWGIAPVHVSIFGSTARSDMNTNSDIDLFIVRPGVVGADDTDWRAALDELARQIERWTGNHAPIAEVSADQLGELRSAQPPIVSQLRSDAIVLNGPRDPTPAGRITSRGHAPRRTVR